jgi:pimeloyl-ACP methyl ester carboxylesterase
MSLRKIALLAALSCAMIGAPAMAAPPPGIPDGWSDAFVYSNGARLHYYHAVPNPGKPVIVMVHGVTDNGLTWTTLTHELEKDYDIYMLDTRGHGLSDPFNDSNDGLTLAKDVVGFIEAMKMEKPILLGHSMGAATVMRIGAEYPTIARAIIMLDPGLPRPPGAAAGPGAGGPRPAGQPPRAAAAPAGAAPAAPAARRPGSLSMFGDPALLVAQNNDPYETFVETCTRQNKLWDPVDCQYWALSKKQYHGAYTPAQQAAMSGIMQGGDALSRITAPALILKADTTPEGRAANTAAAEAAMKTGKLIHVDGAAHNLHHDKRAKTVELITAFLKGV